MVGTQDSGYLTKQYYAAYQSIQCDKEGTDCGSKMGLNVELTNSNINNYSYQYVIKKNDGYELLEPDTFNKYIGKKVTLRSPMFCKGDKLCSICSGKRFHIMNIENAGLTTGRVTNTMLNASMKNFHNAKVQYDEVDINHLLI